MRPAVAACRRGRSTHTRTSPTGVAAARRSTTAAASRGTAAERAELRFIGRGRRLRYAVGSLPPTPNRRDSRISRNREGWTTTGRRLSGYRRVSEGTWLRLPVAAAAVVLQTAEQRLAGAKFRQQRRQIAGAGTVAAAMDRHHPRVCLVRLWSPAVLQDSAHQLLRERAVGVVPGEGGDQPVLRRGQILVGQKLIMYG